MLRGEEDSFLSMFTWLGTHKIPSSLLPTPQLPHHHSKSRRESQGEHQIFTLRSCLHLAQLLITHHINIYRDAYGLVHIMNNGIISWMGN